MLQDLIQYQIDLIYILHTPSNWFRASFGKGYLVNLKANQIKAPNKKGKGREA